MQMARSGQISEKMYFRLVYEHIKDIMNAIIKITEKINHIPIDFMQVYINECLFKFDGPASKRLPIAYTKFSKGNAP